MMKPKIGVMGTIRGITFIQLLQTMGDQACLWAVCESDEKQLEKAKKDIPDHVTVYTDYDAFLDSGIDAVVLCNYFHEHTGCAIKAMQKGIHVLSDTTAAPTLGECVALCKAVEDTGAKYMLGANGPYKKCIQFMKRQIEAGKLGDIYYAEAEYLHDADPNFAFADDCTHWRRSLPATYYNMHTLGTLMYMTNTMPRKVTARAINNPRRRELRNMLHDCGAFSLCEMDNGAVFNVTGCSNYGPTSKWFRLNGEHGAMESKRYDETIVYFASAADHFYPDEPIPVIEEYKPSYSEMNMVSEDEYANFTEEQMKLGHGGIDFWMLLNFIKYLRNEYEPFFNVYRACAVSAAGILGWRSILNGCQEYEIPDFSDVQARKVYENDFVTPFVSKDNPNYIPGMI